MFLDGFLDQFGGPEGFFSRGVDKRASRKEKIEKKKGGEGKGSIAWYDRFFFLFFWLVLVL